MTLGKPYGRCALNFSSPSDRDFVPRSRRKTDSPVAGSTSGRNANSSDVTITELKFARLRRRGAFASPLSCRCLALRQRTAPLRRIWLGTSQSHRLSSGVLNCAYCWSSGVGHSRAPSPAAPCGAARRRGGLIDLTVVDKALAAYPLAEHVRLLLRRKSTEADTGLKGRREEGKKAAPFSKF